MANANGWGDGASNNNIGWGKGADNAIGWGDIHADSWSGATDIVGTPAVDPDAQAFITAAAITDPTQQSAINTLVVDLKGYNVWTKMKALYPFVGGSALAHKFNLKDPRDLDAAFRIIWNGGVTHDANGVQFGGVNGWGDTKFNINSYINNNHISLYIRQNKDEAAVDCGVYNFGFPTTFIDIESRISNVAYFGNFTAGGDIISVANTDSRGLYINTRTSSTIFKIFKNNSQFGLTKTASSTGTLNGNLSLGARYNVSTSTPESYSSKQVAFASIGDGLTDTEAANFYTAVQAFQTTLGRSIGTQTVSDADAQAFVTNAGIVDQVEANAINNLVIGLKADSLWTKMKAIYPFVGGTSTTHKYNLVNPLDTDAAFRLVFSGGWTHSTTGALPNGTNAYADTKFSPNNFTATTNASAGVYLRTNVLQTSVDLGQGYITFGQDGVMIYPRYSSNQYASCCNGNSFNAASNANTDSRGLFAVTRTGTSQSFRKRGTSTIDNTITNTTNTQYLNRNI